MKEIRTIFVVAAPALVIAVSVLALHYAPAADSTAMYIATTQDFRNVALGMENPKQIPVCQTAQLTWRKGEEAAAMGQVGMVGAGFTNISKTTCSLMGYPKLTLIDTDGKPTATFLTHGNVAVLGASATNRVIIKPDQTAYFDLGYTSATGLENSDCVVSMSVRMTPPQSKKYLTVQWQMQPSGGTSIEKSACGAIKVSTVYARG